MIMELLGINIIKDLALLYLKLFIFNILRKKVKRKGLLPSPYRTIDFEILL